MPESDLIILVIDDVQVQTLFERALQVGSYRVAVAADRISLDKLLQETQPALLIISEQVSNYSGMDLCASLLDRFPTLPVLLFTTSESIQLLSQVIQLGLSDCIFPPLNPGAISQAVENALKKAQRMGDWTRREVKITTASLEQKVNELQKLETIFDHFQDGVIILDPHEKLLLVNPSARQAFGLEDLNFSGKDVKEVFTNQDLLGIISLGVTNPLKYNEINFVDKRVYSAQYSEIPGIGKALTMQNITYLKQIEQMKNDFVSTVSHDLRSPLTAILGYVELLDRVGPINAQQKDFIHRVQSSVQDITALINDLLELGRIEAGFSGQADTVSMEAALKYALKNFQLQIAEKNLTVRTHLPKKVPLIYGNPVQIRQLLDNLLGNAVKYTPSGGFVTMNISIDGGQLIFNISDTGPGIPLQDQPHIFEKFYRAGNVPPKVSGSGLGLAIVRSIVDAHHGRIWVDSTLGKGSTFVVVLPLIKTGQLIRAES